ncbi:MAG: 4-(cytidine 5'-diphospho)-2-C-methyl-D-erythritol kinase [Ilumatobacter sp.]|nr:4-(cytidine 5'-diphospho)-2-C-methyl-D-erythritol kinase [Ilumatobacter sp.]
MPGADHADDDEARAETGWRGHAKLTISLRITGVRADGFHLIDAEMVSLDLHDRLLIDPRGDGLSTTGPFAAGVPTDESNIVATALRFAGRRAHVTIDKQIPHGGGLGGGSADAAAVLQWADTPTTDLAAVATIGADVPFCLVGGHARVRGIGEIVDPLPHVDRVFTLVIPPVAVSTPAAYRAWDDLGGRTADGPNDLEGAALRVAPALATWRDRIGDRVGSAPSLAGSGATWFTEGEHHDALADLVDEGATVVLARSVPAEIATNRADTAAR